MTSELAALQESADTAVKVAIESQDNIIAQLKGAQDEARRVREEEALKVERERRKNRNNRIVSSLGIFLLMLMTIFNVINGRHIKSNQDRVIDCTTQGHACYEMGQQQANTLIQRLIDNENAKVTELLAGQETQAREIQGRIDQDYLALQQLIVALSRGQVPPSAFATPRAPISNTPTGTVPQASVGTTVPPTTSTVTSPPITVPTTPVTKPPSHCSIDVLGVLHNVGLC